MCVCVRICVPVYECVCVSMCESVYVRMCACKTVCGGVYMYACIHSECICVQVRALSVHMWVGVYMFVCL